MSKKKHDQDEAEIRALDAEWSKAVIAKTAMRLRVVKFYAADGCVVWPGIRQPKATQPSGPRGTNYIDVPDMYLDFEPTHIEVSSGGDMASDFGFVDLVPGAKPDDSRYGKISRLWKREHVALGKYFTIAGTGMLRRKTANERQCVQRSPRRQGSRRFNKASQFAGLVPTP